MATKDVLGYAPQYYIRIFRRVTGTSQSSNAYSKDGGLNTKIAEDANTGDHYSIREVDQGLAGKNVTVTQKLTQKQLVESEHEYNPKNVFGIRTSKNIDSPAGQWSIEFDYREGSITPNSIFMQIEPMDYVEIFMRRKIPEKAKGVPLLDSNNQPVGFGRFERKNKGNFVSYPVAAQKASEAETQETVAGGMDEDSIYYVNLQWVGPFKKNMPLTIEEKVDNPDFVLCGFVDRVDNKFDVSVDGTNNRIILHGRCVGKILQEHNIFFNVLDKSAMEKLMASQFAIPTLTPVKALDFLLTVYLQGALDPEVQSKSKNNKSLMSWLSSTKTKITFNPEAVGSPITTIIHETPPMSRFIYWAEDMEQPWGRMEDHAKDVVRAVGNVSDGPLWSKLIQLCNNPINEMWIDETGNLVVRPSFKAWNSPRSRGIKSINNETGKIVQGEETFYEMIATKETRTITVSSLYKTGVGINPDFNGTIGNIITGTEYSESEYNFRLARLLQADLSLLIKPVVESTTKKERAINAYLTTTGGGGKKYITTGERINTAGSNSYWITLSTSNLDGLSIDGISYADKPGFFVFYIPKLKGSKTLAEMIAKELNTTFAGAIPMLKPHNAVPIDSSAIQTYRKAVAGKNEDFNLSAFETTVNGEAAVIVRIANAKPLIGDTSFLATGDDLDISNMDLTVSAIEKAILAYQTAPVKEGGKGRKDESKDILVDGVKPVKKNVKRHWGGDHITLFTKDICNWQFSRTDEDLKTVVTALPSSTVLALTAIAAGTFGQVPITQEIQSLIEKSLHDSILTENTRIKNLKQQKKTPSKTDEKALQDAQKSFASTKLLLQRVRTKSLSHVSSFPLINDKDVFKFWARFGMRPMSINDIYNYRTADLVDSALTLFRRSLNAFWRGTITVKGDARYKIGRILDLPELGPAGCSFYIHGVENEFQWGNNWTTTLQVTDGRMVDSTTDPYLVVKKVESVTGG